MVPPLGGVVEHIHREAAGFSIITCDLVDNLHSLRVTPTAHEIFGAFIKMEDKEAKHEEGKHEATHCVKEIAPALVL